MCYRCTTTSPLANTILEHTLRNHPESGNFSLRQKVLDESTGHHAFRSLHFEIAITELNTMIDDGCKPYIDSHHKKITFKRLSGKTDQCSKRKQILKNEKELQTENRDIFQVLPEVMEKLPKIGRLEDFHSVLVTISSGALLGNFC
jgi:hypothetical protein